MVERGSPTPAALVTSQPTPSPLPPPSPPPPPSSTTSAPTVTLQPSNQTVPDGTTATFTASASGTPQPSVQWRISDDSGVEWNTVSGATSTSYSFAASSSEDGDEFEAIFTNSAGAATTDAATLTIDPAIIEQPESEEVLANTTAWFTAEASGSPTPAIQWQVSTNDGATWQPVSGQTSSCYSFSATTSDNNEEVEAVFTSGLGSTTTDAAELTVGTAGSTNWSGYAVTDPCAASTFEDVTASWTVASVSCLGVTTDQYSSQWIGIDGFASSTVEQDGTESDCRGGTAQYDAWYEMYGDPAVDGGYEVELSPSQYPVSPGDEITASVSISGEQWTLTLDDSHWSGSFSTTIDFSGAAESSAEWIVERPETCSNCAFPQLANFGTAFFSDANAATASSPAEPITDYSTTGMDMVNNADTSVLDEVDTPTDYGSGDSFDVTWRATGP